MSIDDLSLSELFRVEAQMQVAKLIDGLIALDEGGSASRLEDLMRAAHSLKGAARIVGHDAAVRVAHEIESCFVAAQENKISLTRERIDVLLRGVDMLSAISATDPDTAERRSQDIESVLSALRDVMEPASAAEAPPPPAGAPELTRSRASGELPSAADSSDAPLSAASPPQIPDASERLLTLAGETLVASRVLASALATASLERGSNRPVDRAGLERMGERVSDSVAALYQAVLDARMRPFADGVAGMPRMVRDTARELGRDVRLVITGESTPVDREVLRRLEAPLGHLVRNAVDHGIEAPAERERRGKPARGSIRIDARHAGGRLLVSVEDDGRGVDLGAVRQRIVERGHADAAAAGGMSELELASFLFLPGFTLRDSVTSISGRGVGLDAVHTAVREIGGDVRVRASPGVTRFEMQLPLTLSVVRALVTQIGGESYAFPLARVRRVLRVPRDEISSVENRQHFELDDRRVGLIWAHQLLGVQAPALEDIASVVVVGDAESAVGVVVDALVGEEELVLRGLDDRLGKVQDISGAAILHDGALTLVLDVDDLLRSASNLAAGGRLDPLRHAMASAPATRKRVLVVDDSLTVRELERKMIESKGYAVDVAVDGMDAWNAVRSGRYDLVVTDVDMPRMDGIELVTRIKADAQLRSIAVMIVSYKDRDEDRRRGLDAGADYYLTKGSFYDETMLRAIEDFIGVAT